MHGLNSVLILLFNISNRSTALFNISNGGELYDLLSQKNHFVSKYDFNQIKSILEKIDNKKYEAPDTNFDQFELTEQTKRLTKILI